MKIKITPVEDTITDRSGGSFLEGAGPHSYQTLLSLL